MSDLEHQTRQLLQQARQLLDKAKETRERASAALREQGIDNLPAYLETHAASLHPAQREQIERLVRQKEIDGEKLPGPYPLPAAGSIYEPPRSPSATAEAPAKPPKRFRQMV